MNQFLSIADVSCEQIEHMLDLAVELREQRRQGRSNQPLLAGKTLAMIFEKPSLRTRVSFEQAMIELGGHAIVLGQNEVGLGKREAVADVARVLGGLGKMGGMVQGIAARVFDHQNLIEMAQASSVPVINMLSDESHPCQALADALTLRDEFAAPNALGLADLKGRTVAFIGDGNNVARSLAFICAKLGMNFILASPPGYALEQAFADRVMAQAPAMQFEMTHDPVEAARRADALYADTFVSMGQEAEKEQRIEAFKGFQINEQLLAAAPKHAVVLHCLPAYRGIEITDEVMDGPRSRVFPQAHNRLHAQKGLLAMLMGGA